MHAKYSEICRSHLILLELKFFFEKMKRPGSRAYSIILNIYHEQYLDMHR